MQEGLSHVIMTATLYLSSPFQQREIQQNFQPSYYKPENYKLGPTSSERQISIDFDT